MVIGKLKVGTVTNGKDYYLPGEECIIERVFIMYSCKQLWCEVKVISGLGPNRTNQIITPLKCILR